MLSLLVMAALSALACDDNTHPSAPQPAPPPVPVVTGATGGAPGPREGDPEPHPKRIIIIKTGVPEKKLHPWEVHIEAPGANIPFINEPVTGTTYSTRLLIDADSDALITVEVKLPKPGSELGYCAIESGNQHDGPRFFQQGGWRLNCYLKLKPMK
jgi:hypothetical protein